MSVPVYGDAKDVQFAPTRKKVEALSGKIVKVSGPLVVATGLKDANMADVVRVGEQRLIGEILNMNGELIGINEAKYSSTQVEGMGFAIPISKAEPILQNLMNLTTRYKVSDDEAAYIGINMADVSADVSQNYGIPTGVCIMSVVDGSPAADAGFKKGDVITTFDGRSISNAKGLKETLTYYAAGETVDVTVQRADNGEYKEVTLTLTLGSAADMPQTSGSSNGTTNDGTGSSDQNDQGIQNPFGNR